MFFAVCQVILADYKKLYFGLDALHIVGGVFKISAML